MSAPQFASGPGDGWDWEDEKLVVRDKWPSKHRIRTIRDEAGMLLGFGLTAPGGKTIVQRFSHYSLGSALASLDSICDYIYGPVRADQERIP